MDLLIILVSLSILMACLAMIASHPGKEGVRWLVVLSANLLLFQLLLVLLAINNELEAQTSLLEQIADR